MTILVDSLRSVKGLHFSPPPIWQIAEEMQRLQGLAKAGRLPDHDLKEGTITVSNVGTIGGTYATPLINLPEVAIVALGKVQTLPRYRGGELRPVSVMQVRGVDNIL